MYKNYNKFYIYCTDPPYDEEKNNVRIKSSENKNAIELLTNIFFLKFLSDPRYSCMFLYLKRVSYIFLFFLGFLNFLLNFSKSDRFSMIIMSLIQLKTVLAQNMKFSIKGFFSKCDQICNFLWIWPSLLRKSLMNNFILCEVFILIV